MGCACSLCWTPFGESVAAGKSNCRSKTRIGLDQQQQHIALLPGSRRGEIERLGPLVLDAAYILTQKYPQFKFLIPAINDT